MLYEWDPGLGKFKFEHDPCLEAVQTSAQVDECKETRIEPVKRCRQQIANSRADAFRLIQVWIITRTYTFCQTWTWIVKIRVEPHEWCDGSQSYLVLTQRVQPSSLFTKEHHNSSTSINKPQIFISKHPSNKITKKKKKIKFIIIFVIWFLEFWNVEINTIK